jgi:hypothetical protein
MRVGSTGAITKNTPALITILRQFLHPERQNLAWLIYTHTHRKLEKKFVTIGHIVREK